MKNMIVKFEKKNALLFWLLQWKLMQILVIDLVIDKKEININ